MDRRYRKPLIAGNWKMNLLPSQVPGFAAGLKPLLPAHRTAEAALCAPATHLPALRRAVKGMRLALGAQDVSDCARGAYTGEVSAEMLADLGVKYVIVGHSERRARHGETDALAADKVRAALDAGLCPILCVGESLAEREAGLTAERIALQTRAGLCRVGPEELRLCVVAYEPLWAIGTGRTAAPEEAQTVCGDIRAVLRHRFGARPARAVRILYGGSMTPENAAGLLSQPDIDGGLIGGASLKPESFAALLAAAEEAE